MDLDGDFGDFNDSGVDLGGDGADFVDLALICIVILLISVIWDRF